MENKRILMFGHGGYDNRGCEAIIRSTSKMIAEKFKLREIKVASYKYAQDSKVILDEVDKYIPHETEIIRYTWPWIKSIYYNRISKDYEASFMVTQRDVIKEVADSDICISVGGDNYCYGEPVHLYAMDRSIKKLGKKLVLWGASIEPTSLSERMANDLKQFDALFARESITYNELKRLNINRNIYIYPDPAFAMEKEELPLPKGWISGKMIGLNLSPLIMNYESDNGVVFTAFLKLIDKIIRQTDFNIVLIPHVVSENNNDYDVLKKLYEQYKSSGRLILLGTNYTAPQLKGFISRCRLFVGARTHSTIAAYSTCVPTLVMGYSIKSIGIAIDIFGMEKNYVLPVQDLTYPEQLISGFNYLLQNEKAIRIHLGKMMPLYIKKAEDAVNKLAQICLMKG